mmetsp:Transcript_27758/g.89082  ORF Transcript_27758/g.89082 Transcript_27758/m.89082 type:complete len:357 (-) Transcript_27758:94-1164(-)
MSADAMPSARWVRVVGNTPWMSAVGLNATLPAEKKGDGTAGPPRRRPPPRPVFPPGQGSSAAPTLGCLLRALFAPSAWLAAAVEARRRELFGDSPFEGVHLRLGAGRGPDVAERCSREMRPRDAAEVDCSRLGIRRRDLAGRLEGPSHPASTPPLPRPGDGAAGTAFRPGTVPTTDRRMTVDGAVSVMRCLASAGSSPVFVATDNARLKAAILAGKRGGGGGGGSGGEEVALTRSGGGRLVLPPALAGRFRAQGCADCMVNPVFQHNFTRESVQDIFVEMARDAAESRDPCPDHPSSSIPSGPRIASYPQVMLAHSRCFHHASSNFATTVLALAPPGACHGHYGAERCGRCECSTS